MSIIVENPDSTEALNALLHDYGRYIVGRMGIPYREKKINIISIAIDAPPGYHRRPLRQGWQAPGHQRQNRLFERNYKQ